MAIPIDHTQPVFRSLADPTRRAIVMLLADTPLSVGHIADQFDMTRPAVAKHLKILNDSDIIHIRPVGRERINHLNPDAIKAAYDWLNVFDRFWDDRLTALKEIAEKTHE